MNKVIQRLLVFFIGLPLVIGIVYFNQYNHILLQLLLAFFIITGTLELHAMVAKKLPVHAKPFVFLMTIIPVISASLAITFRLNPFVVDFTFIGAIMLCLAWEVFTSKEFEDSLCRIATSVFSVLYCGYFPTFIVRLTGCPYSRILISTFILMVCMTDSIAWFFGVLLGKNNKGIVKASPNKSVAGFIGGFIGCISSAIFMQYLFPAIFSGSVWKMILFGFLTAFASVTGDLVESVLKRSSGVKDSGRIIPGRGGALDCIDSILFAAPVFFVMIGILFPGVLQ